MRGHPGDRGDTLVELLIALAIIGISTLAIVGAMTTGVVISDRHRKQAVAASSVMSYAEAVKQAAETTGYQSTCSPNYASTAPTGPVFTAPAGYTKSIVATSFWTGSAFQASCLASGDTGIQRVTLQVASSDGRASEQLVVIVRKPCRTTDSACP